jgi:hypothetical protein
MEEISLMPLEQEQEPSLELSARLKAQQILNMWEQNSAAFQAQLFSYLEAEKDLQRLLALEKRLQNVTGCSGGKGGDQGYPPPYFWPVTGGHADPDHRKRSWMNAG